MLKLSTIWSLQYGRWDSNFRQSKITSRKFAVCYETFHKTFLLILIYFQTRPARLWLGKVKLGGKVRPLTLQRQFLSFFIKKIMLKLSRIWKLQYGRCDSNKRQSKISASRKIRPVEHFGQSNISASRTFPLVCYETFQKTFLLILIYFQTRPARLWLGKAKLGEKQGCHSPAKYFVPKKHKLDNFNFSPIFPNSKLFLSIYLL